MIKEYLYKLLDLLKSNLNKDNATEPLSTFFAKYSTPQMEGLEELHNSIMFYLAIILFAVSWMMVSIMINFKNKKISNKYVQDDTLVELIWTFFPALMLILIVIPPFKLLLLIDDLIDPSLVIYGEGHQWYLDTNYPCYVIEEQGNQVCYMDVSSIINLEPWYDVIPDMTQYVYVMKQFEGKTLNEANITLNRLGPKNRLNVLTWYFHEKDPGAFLYYDKDETRITSNFLHRATVLPFDKKEYKIPQEFLSKYNVTSIAKLPY